MSRAAKKAKSGYSASKPFRIHIENESKLMPVFTVYPKEYRAALDRFPDIARIVDTTWGIDGDVFDTAIKAHDNVDKVKKFSHSKDTIELDHIESLSTRNPLGVKGLGEGGAIGPPAAIANAVEDALKAFGVVVRRGPLTSNRVLQLVQDARKTS
jgi:hypothetical protein